MVEKVHVKYYKDIQEDIIRRSSKHYYKTYYIINKKGYIRVQNRKDTFSRHYLLTDIKEMLYDMNELIIETAEPRKKIEKHMKHTHVEYCDDCDIRE